MSPRGREPEAGLCLSLPPSTIGRDGAGGWLDGCAVVAGVCTGPSPGCNPSGGGSAAWSWPTTGPCVQTYLHIYQ